MPNVYLDHNATTPLLPEVREAMQVYLGDQWFNPSSGHRGAKLVRKAIEESRAQVARLLGATPEEIIFTSGGTESINTALRMVDQKGARILTTAAEHSAAYETLQELAKERGIEVVSIGVGADGLLDLEELARELKVEGNYLLNILWANNETGVVQPLAEIIDMAHQAGVPVHVDAVQAAGKMPLSPAIAAADYVSISGHKINGPKGIGALMVRKARRFSSLISGGGQEQKRRGGTENVPGIIGLGKACELIVDGAGDEGLSSVAAKRDRLEKGLTDQLECRVNGNEAPRLANTSSITFPGCHAEGLLLLLEDAGLICSTGSACSTGKLQPSRVLTAMGLSRADAKSTLRFSLSQLTTDQEIDHALEVIPKAVAKLKSVQSPIAGPVVVYRPKS